MTEFMRNTDAFTWSMESDPRLRSTVVTVILLDRSPDWDLIRERFDIVSRELPMFRQRVVETLPPAPPRWEYAPDFDLDFHMRRVSAPEPGTVEGVLEMARLAAMDDFDRARPMWKATLIEGLDDGGAAVLCKFHHALTDGVGGVQIAMTLFDLTEEPRAMGDLPAEPVVPTPQPFDGYRDAVRYDVGLVRSAVVETVKTAPKLLFNSIRRPLQTAAAAGELAASDGDYDTAIAALREAASVEDQIPYDEPPGWHAPARHTLGALLLAADRASEAEAVYREELQRNPHNGWSLYGLMQSLRAQQREDEAAEAQKAFEAAWQFADVELSSSRL